MGWISYAFPNFNSCTVAVWEWIINFIPHFILDVITYPISMLGFKLNHVSKRGPRWHNLFRWPLILVFTTTFHQTHNWWNIKTLHRCPSLHGVKPICWYGMLWYVCYICLTFRLVQFWFLLTSWHLYTAYWNVKCWYYRLMWYHS